MLKFNGIKKLIPVVSDCTVNSKTVEFGVISETIHSYLKAVQII